MIRNIVIVAAIIALPVAGMLVASNAEGSVIKASWYGEELRGHLTASGEPFDPDAHTAAHPTIPFGTQLRVSHEDASTKVRVTDRGPVDPDVAIDLSEAAAEDLGIIEEGVAEVTIAEIRESNPQDEASLKQKRLR